MGYAASVGGGLHWEMPWLFIRAVPASPVDLVAIASTVVTTPELSMCLFITECMREKLSWGCDDM